jgi:hypothetical protein
MLKLLQGTLMEEKGRKNVAQHIAKGAKSFFLKLKQTKTRPCKEMNKIY